MTETRVVLTFDDGPSEWTPAILDLLAKHRQRAIFFVTGVYCADLPELLIRMRTEGHAVGNHGYTHRRLTDLNDMEVRRELDMTSRVIESLLGARPTLFRAPFFAVDDGVLAIAESLGMTHVGASIIPDDWATDDHEAVARVVLDELRPGSVVSLHDGVPPDGGSTHCTKSRQPTVEAVRLILAGMAA